MREREIKTGFVKSTSKIQNKYFNYINFNKQKKE